MRAAETARHGHHQGVIVANACVCRFLVLSPLHIVFTGTIFIWRGFLVGTT